MRIVELAVPPQWQGVHLPPAGRPDIAPTLLASDPRAGDQLTHLLTRGSALQQDEAVNMWDDEWEDNLDGMPGLGEEEADSDDWDEMPALVQGVEVDGMPGLISDDAMEE